MYVYKEIINCVSNFSFRRRNHSFDTSVSFIKSCMRGSVYRTISAILLRADPEVWHIKLIQFVLTLQCTGWNSTVCGLHQKVFKVQSAKRRTLDCTKLRYAHIYAISWFDEIFMKYVLIVVAVCTDIHGNLHDCYIFNIDKSTSIEYCKSKTCVPCRLQ